MVLLVDCQDLHVVVGHCYYLSAGLSEEFDLVDLLDAESAPVDRLAV